MGNVGSKSRYLGLCCTDHSFFKNLSLVIPPTLLQCHFKVQEFIFFLKRLLSLVAACLNADHSPEVTDHQPILFKSTLESNINSLADNVFYSTHKGKPGKASCSRYKRLTDGLVTSCSIQNTPCTEILYVVEST